MSSETDIITRFFTRSPRRNDVVRGVGDDAAILRPVEGQDLLISVDTLVEHIHFTPDIEPDALGYRALAVNLSDMAAMGAEPAWATLALTLPKSDPAWLARFSAGFLALADQHDVDLIGGNLSRGPLSVTVQIHGYAPPGAAFRRDAAQPGDLIFVTGTLGDAGLARLMPSAGGTGCSQEAVRFLRERLERPRPRVREAMALRGLVNAAIDLSDGLAADLDRVLVASGVGATLRLAGLPLSPAFRSCMRASDLQGIRLALTAGDDYELCFTAPAQRRSEIESALTSCGVACIGTIEARPGLRCLLPDGTSFTPREGGWDHFTETR